MVVLWENHRKPWENQRTMMVVHGILWDVPFGKRLHIWKINIFDGKTHYRWPFSIATLNYQRISRDKTSVYLSKINPVSPCHGLK